MERHQAGVVNRTTVRFDPGVAVYLLELCSMRLALMAYPGLHSLWSHMDRSAVLMQQSTFQSIPSGKAFDDMNSIGCRKKMRRQSYSQASSSNIWKSVTRQQSMEKREHMHVVANGQLQQLQHQHKPVSILTTCHWLEQGSQHQAAALQVTDLRHSTLNRACRSGEPDSLLIEHRHYSSSRGQEASLRCSAGLVLAVGLSCRV